MEKPHLWFVEGDVLSLQLHMEDICVFHYPDPYLRYSFSELVIVLMSQSSLVDRSTSLAFSSEWITIIIRFRIREFSELERSVDFVGGPENPNTQYKYVTSNYPCENKTVLQASGVTSRPTEYSRQLQLLLKATVSMLVRSLINPLLLYCLHREPVAVLC